jgi:PAS domain S-box-containing protein
LIVSLYSDISIEEDMETIEGLHKQNSELTTENERLRELSRQVEQVTRAFQESQSRFRTVFEASRLGNKIIASDLKILQINAAMVTLLGYSTKEEIIGKAILDFSPPERHEEWRYLQQQLWQQSAPSFSLETVLRKQDGSLIWCQVTSILFIDNGETLGYTIIEDITEQYKLRQQKEEFISVASHELKTPVTSLNASLQLLSRLLDKKEPDLDHLRKVALSAEKSTGKLVYMITDLLNLTKIEQGQLALNRTRFPAAEMIESSCIPVQLDSTQEWNFEGDRDVMIYADAQKVEQVLVNLINNAIKYAPDSPVITVKVENLPSAVKISVVDRGPGIAPEHVDQLFERYFRVDGEKNRNSGLGLGLYISAEIIRRHGGEIGVQSQVGEGSTFWFTLPNAASVQ